MSLSNSVVTHLLDPNVDNTRRTEFRLPEGVLGSSMKLVDVGVYLPGMTDNNGWYYDAISGVYSAISRITLYSGSEILDQISYLGAYAAFKSQMCTNQTSEDLGRFEQLSGKNWSTRRYGNLSLHNVNRDYTNYCTNAADAQRQNDQIRISGSAEGGPSGSIVLSDVLEFLASVSVLPGIPNLRLVIDWRTDLNAGTTFWQDPTATAIAANFFHKRPSLIVEELLGVEIPKEGVKIPCLQNIVESFVVPVAPPGNKVRNSYRSNAFRGRYLKDLVLWNQFNGDWDWLRANSRCVAQEDEIIQLVLNGRKFLPDQGIANHGTKAQLLNETRGPVNVPMGCYMNSPVNGGENLCEAGRNSDHILSNFSPTAVSIESIVDRLDIEYQRTGHGAGAQHLGFNLLAFGRCARMLEIKGDKIRLSY